MSSPLITLQGPTSTKSPDSGGDEDAHRLSDFPLYPLPHHLALANGRGTAQPICTTTSADCAIFTPFSHLRACHEDEQKKREMSSCLSTYFSLLLPPSWKREIAPTARTGTMVGTLLLPCLPG